MPNLNQNIIKGQNIRFLHLKISRYQVEDMQVNTIMYQEKYFGDK